MKNKYQRLSKEEKRNCRKRYYETSKGKEMHIRLTRLVLTGIIGLMFSLFLVVNGIIDHTLDIGTWLIIVPLTVASGIFIISSFYLRLKNLNQYAIKNFK